MKCASRSEVEKFVGELKDTYLQCREMGHNWLPFSASIDSSTRTYVRVLRCSRCHTQRHQELSMSGEILRSHYVYPDEYLANIGRIVGDGRDAMRLESVVRSVEKLAN